MRCSLMCTRFPIHACCVRRKEEAAALGLKAVVPGEATEDALAVTAPLAIACWCAQRIHLEGCLVASGQLSGRGAVSCEALQHAVLHLPESAG